MIKLIPEEYKNEFSMAIAKGDFEAVKTIIEKNAIDVNSFMNTESYTPAIMQVLTAYGINDENERLAMLQYFLEKGADPNICSKSGYNCLHIAAQNNKLAKALKLFLDLNGDVNLTDANGATVAYWMIQAFPWRTEGEERQLHLDIVEKVMMLGADLDLANKFGATPRKWLEHSPEDVTQLIAKCEALHPVYMPVSTLQPAFPSNLKYPDVAKKIWKELVPQIGQADTVQGELLRAVEKLRDEAQRNGNINHRDAHKRLAKFIQDTLVQAEIFDKKDIARIKAETKKLMKGSVVVVEDEIYDYLTDQVCMFCLKNETPIPREKDLNITC